MVFCLKKVSKVQLMIAWSFLATVFIMTPIAQELALLLRYFPEQNNFITEWFR